MERQSCRYKFWSNRWSPQKFERKQPRKRPQNDHENHPRNQQTSEKNSEDDHHNKEDTKTTRKRMKTTKNSAKTFDDEKRPWEEQKNQLAIGGFLKGCLTSVRILRFLWCLRPPTVLASCLLLRGPAVAQPVDNQNVMKPGDHGVLEVVSSYCRLCSRLPSVLLRCLPWSFVSFTLGELDALPATKGPQMLVLLVPAFCWQF